MRPAPETHAAHLLRPVPTNTPRVPSFEGSAEDKSSRINSTIKQEHTPFWRGGRYWVRQGLGSERQLNWQSLQRATAEFIFTIFCPKLCVCYFNEPPPLTQYNYIPCTTYIPCLHHHVYGTSENVMKNYRHWLCCLLNTWQHWYDQTRSSFH